MAVNADSLSAVALNFVQDHCGFRLKYGTHDGFVRISAHPLVFFSTI
jgi:hypothetical protein